MIARIVCGLWLTALLMARTRETRVSWDQLPQSVQGKQVRVELAGKGVLKGKLARIRPDGLEIQRGSSQRDVARSNVARILSSERKRVKWRIIGTAIGAGAASPLLAYSEALRRNEGGIYSNRNTGIAAAIMAGAAALGFAAGRAADTDTEVWIVQ